MGRRWKDDARAYAANKRRLLGNTSATGSRAAIPARFPGTCRECGGRVAPGDLVVWFPSTKAVEHASCDDRRRREARS